MSAKTALLLTFGVLAAAPVTAQDKPPKTREIKALIEEFLTLDGRKSQGRARQLEIVARLDLVSLEKKTQLKKWTKELDKRLPEAGPKLQPGGDHFFWPNSSDPDSEERGRYFVGGETKKPKGLLIAMHGGGVGSGDARSAHGTYSRVAEEFGLVSISPEVLKKTERGWTDSGTEEFILDLVDAALRTWEIDPSKVWFAGHSMGGYGTWTLGAHHADRVAGLAPSAGAPVPIFNRPGGDVIDVEEGVIANLRNVRMAIFQSTDDPRVPPGPNQKAVALLGEAKDRWGGFDFEYWEVDNRGHGMPPGGAQALFAKVAEAERNPVPERIVWQPALSWKRQCYWLHWERPKRHAVMVADLDREKNAVTITCVDGKENQLGDPIEPKGLQVLLDERVLDLGKEIVVTVNGTEVFRGMAERTLGSLMMTSSTMDVGRRFLARVRCTAE